MNDSARENPMSGNPAAGRPAAPVAIECPQCGTPLRLLRPATIHTPIACCICGATFYLEPVETAPMSETMIAPRRTVNGQGRPVFRSASPPGHPVSDRAARPPGDAPSAMTTPVPPAPVPGTRFAPGMPRPVELPEHLNRAFRTRWLESVLGASLILLLVVAACAGGFVLLRTLWAPRSTGPTALADVPTGTETPDNDSKSGRASAGNPDSVGATTAAANSAGTAQKMLPRPESLSGTWESRVDDGSQSSFVFRPDGTVDVAQAGDPPPPIAQYNWYLVEQRGDILVLDIGPELGQMGNARLTIRFPGPDAFTLLKFIRHGLIQPGGELRYILSGPPTARSARPSKVASTLVPFIGLPNLPP